MTELFKRISEEKRQRVINAAIEEFATCGYKDANTNTIARHANISVGSLYKYFTSKETLFLSVVDYVSDILKQSLANVLDEEEDISNVFEKVLRLIQRHSRDNGNMVRLYHEMTVNNNAAIVKEAIENLEAVTAKIYASLIRQAQDKGQARLDCDPDVYGFLIDNLFMGLQFSYACEYYGARFKVYIGEDALKRDDFIVSQTLNFIRAALK